MRRSTSSTASSPAHSRWSLACALLSAPLGAASCSSPKDVKSSGCESCHRPNDSIDGLEEQHPLFALRCVDCHGGNPAASSVEQAHVANSAEGGDIRSLSAKQLEATDPSYRRFVNPGDPIVAAQTCGSAGSQGGQGCHQAIVDASLVSSHASNVGLINVPRFTAGLLSSRGASLGVVSLVDDDFKPASAPPNTFGSLAGISIEAIPATPTAGDAQRLLDHALAKGCSGCHLGVYGARGAGRPNADFAGGCSACHMFYEDDGLSQSRDPARDKTSTPHPVRHVIERFVPDRQCERCHSRSTRIGTQFRGLRERTSGEDSIDLRNAKLVEQAIHGRPAGHFVEDEDTRDTIDITPPDIHRQRGMACVDCHLAPDGHGDGFIHASMAGEVGIECQDCHGTFDAPAGMNGEFKTSGNAVLKRVRREGDRVILTGALDGKEHPVTQIVNLRPSLAQENAHKTASHGELECYACHTAWMQNAYLLRRTLDYRAKSDNAVDGTTGDGTVTDADEIQTLGDLQLGINSDGKIGTFMVENALFDVVVPCNPANEPAGTCTNSPEQPIFGKKVINGYIGRTADGRRGLSWTPVFAHTTADRGSVQPCERCHPRQFERDPNETADPSLRTLDTVRQVYGFGNENRGFFANDTGTTDPFDLTQMIDANGSPVVALGHPGTSPVPMDRIRRALNYRVEPPLR